MDKGKKRDQKQPRRSEKRNAKKKILKKKGGGIPFIEEHEREGNW